MKNQKQRVIQFSLILIGIILIFLTYVLYPKIQQSNLMPENLLEKESTFLETVKEDLKILPDKVFEKKYERTKKQFKEEVKIAKKTEKDLKILSDKAFEQKYKKTKTRAKKDKFVNEKDLMGLSDKMFEEKYERTKKEAKDEIKIVENNDTNILNTFENVEYKGLYNLDKPFIVTSRKAHVLNDSPNIVYMSNMKVLITMKDGRVVTITSNQGRYDKFNYDFFFEYNVKATDGEIIMLSENLDLLSTSKTATLYNKVILSSEAGSLKADQINYDFNNEKYEVSMFDKGKVKIKLIK